jgi:hypothetical protein
MQTTTIFLSRQRGKIYTNNKKKKKKNQHQLGVAHHVIFPKEPFHITEYSTVFSTYFLAVLLPFFTFAICTSEIFHSLRAGEIYHFQTNHFQLACSYNSTFIL